jgi:enoyl-CoA hydratase/carnithine racemase
MPGTTIAFSTDDRVGRLTLNRPEAGNAFTTPMLDELGAALAEVAASTDILVLSGAGGDFTLGRDRGEPKGAHGPFPAFRQVSGINALLAGYPGISIAAVGGRAHGFGVGIIMRCDLAVASETAHFGLDEVKLGIAPMFIMEEILEHLPPKWALDLILSGREVAAAEALQLGLLSRVVPAAELDATVSALVDGLRRCDARVLRACKRYIRAVKDVPGAARSAFALVEQTRFAMEQH